MIHVVIDDAPEVVFVGMPFGVDLLQEGVVLGREELHHRCLRVPEALLKGGPSPGLQRRVIPPIQAAVHRHRPETALPDIENGELPFHEVGDELGRAVDAGQGPAEGIFLVDEPELFFKCLVDPGVAGETGSPLAEVFG